MPFFKDSDQAEISKMLADMKNPVTIKLFTQSFECTFCADTHQLLDELSTISDKLSLEVYDFVKDSQSASELGIDKIPGFALISAKDYGVRFFGIPAGYEFASLLQSLILVSTGDSRLQPETKKALAEIKAPVHLQVFLTPT